MAAKSDSIAEIHAAYADRTGEWFDANPVRVSVRGRVISKRVMGETSFVTIDDGRGQIVLCLQREIFGVRPDPFESFDVGDVLGGNGQLFRTKTRELWIKATAVTVRRHR